MSRLSQSDQDRIRGLLEKNPIDQAEMEFVVERYIYDKKGITINIDLLKNLDSAIVRLMPELFVDQIIKLSRAFTVARAHFLETIC